jgi:hypothetical protein
LPPAFHGVLDLSVCNSLLAGESIRRRHRCTVIANEWPADIHFYCARYKLTVDLLAQRPQDYVDALMFVHRTITETRG